MATSLPPIPDEVWARFERCVKCEQGEDGLHGTEPTEQFKAAYPILAAHLIDALFVQYCEAKAAGKLKPDEERSDWMWLHNRRDEWAEEVSRGD